MSLHVALNLVLEEYLGATQTTLAENQLAALIRKDIPHTILEALDTNARYIVRGSVGQGNWARVPWVAVFDRFVTDSARNGYYLVYLVREDFSGVYLSLNQGITSVKKQYGSDAKYALRARANDFLARLGKLADGLIKGPIDLRSSLSTSLGAYYEHGAICSVFYEKSKLPEDSVLFSDLRRLIDLYTMLVSLESRLYEKATDGEVDEENLGLEDLRLLREHKRIERNKKLAANAKKIHGYQCKSCGFDFEKKYGQLGKNFIEAHHLTPLHTLKGQRVSLHPKRDFTVLCSNCHRMIHKSEFVNKVEEFREKYVVEPNDCK